MCIWQTGSPHTLVISTSSGYNTVLAGPFLDCQRRKSIRLGFLGRAGPPDNRIWHRKIFNSGLLLSRHWPVSMDVFIFSVTDSKLIVRTPPFSRVRLLNAVSLVPFVYSELTSYTLSSVLYLFRTAGRR